MRWNILPFVLLHMQHKQQNSGQATGNKRIPLLLLHGWNTAEIPLVPCSQLEINMSGRNYDG